VVEENVPTILNKEGNLILESLCLVIGLTSPIHLVLIVFTLLSVWTNKLNK